MIMSSTLLILLCFITGSLAMYCEGTTQFGKNFTLYVDTVYHPKVMVFRVGSEERFWNKISFAYDGYMTGFLIGFTPNPDNIASGDISVRYDNIYGCLRNIIVLTDVNIKPIYFGALYVPVCRGGSQSDFLCTSTNTSTNTSTSSNPSPSPSTSTITIITSYSPFTTSASTSSSGSTRTSNWPSPSTSTITIITSYQ